MKTIGEVLKLSAEFLKKKGIERPTRIAEDLLSWVLCVKRIDLYLQFDLPLAEKELALMRDFIRRSAENEPFEYIVGETEFLGCPIRIDRRALIPRPETEILAEMISKRARTGVLWDICTGSGCIGISLKKKSPSLKVSISDLSEEALSLAAENVKKNEVDLSIFHGDLLAPFKGQKADWIVCNPPYVSSSEYETLDVSVKRFEPSLALLGGEKGIDIYERLQKELPFHLHSATEVFLEIGAGQKEILQKMFPGAHIYPDWAGHPRFLCFKGEIFL